MSDFWPKIGHFQKSEKEDLFAEIREGNLASSLDNYSGKQKIGLNVLVAVNETAESNHFCMPSFSKER